MTHKHKATKEWSWRAVIAFVETSVVLTYVAAIVCHVG